MRKSQMQKSPLVHSGCRSSEGRATAKVLLVPAALNVPPCQPSSCELPSYQSPYFYTELYYHPEFSTITMDRFRRMFHWNRAANTAPPTDPSSSEHSQSVLTHPPSHSTESWTTHDSNLELLKCLSTATPTRPALPTETILQILEDPSRWVHIHNVYHPPLPNSNKPILYTSNKPTGDPVLYTRSLSARDTTSLRRVTFTFCSRDQGWCSKPDDGSWSWFEASLARISRDEEGEQTQLSDAIVTTSQYSWVYPWLQRHREELEEQPRYKIQSNRIGETEPESYTIELGADHELVQRVREGDRIILWSCACFPGWNNQVYEAQIAIEGVDDFRMEKIAEPSVTNDEGQEGHLVGLFDRISL